MPVAAAVETKPIKAVVVEDNKDEGFQIKSALQRAGVSLISYFESFDEANVIEIARYADIVSLDLELEHGIEDSLRAAQVISRLNPYGGNFFYTREPRKLKENPFNFAIEKYKPAGRAYESVSWMVLAHNRCLSILDSFNRLLHAGDDADVGEMLADFRDRADRFYSSLSSMIEWFSSADPGAARRYHRLRSLLEPASYEPIDGLVRGDFLTTIHRPVILSVRDELERLRGIEGVYLTDELPYKVEDLISSVSVADVGGRLREVAERFAGEAEADYSETGDARVQPATQKIEEEANTDTLYLNAWFPSCVEKRSPLPVGQPADLKVNVGPVPYAKLLTGGGSDPIAADKSHLFYSIESVDVMVLCPGARVEPLCQVLTMPPGPNATVTFKLTPTRGGKLQVTVVILVHNDPIHRSSFSFEAFEAGAAGETLTTEERARS